MSRIKDWFADHKEIILAGGTFLLGCIVTGTIERSRHILYFLAPKKHGLIWN